MLTVERKQVGSSLVLHLSGKLLIGRPCDLLERHAEEALRQNHAAVIFDLTHTTAMDSSGLGVIVASARKLAAAGVHPAVAGATGAIESLARRTGVQKRIAFSSTVEEALSAAPTARSPVSLALRESAE